LWHFIESLKGKMTIILTTHYLEEAESLSDKIAIMSKGHLVAQGSVQDLMKQTKSQTFEDAFVSLCGVGGQIS
ncbi:MAG: ABC transporter ATP-binding protein, partial [Coprobacillus sp.]